MIILRVTLKALHYVVVVQSPIVIWIIHQPAQELPFLPVDSEACLHFQFSGSGQGAVFTSSSVESLRLLVEEFLPLKLKPPGQGSIKSQEQETNIFASGSLG